MRRALIVSPNFPPVNIPDHQRIRMSLPYLRDYGWHATVLAVAPQFIEDGVQEKALLKTVPSDIEVIRVNALPHRWARRFGIGDLSFRAFAFLQGTGSKLISSGRYDVVFFSTTRFPIMVLGPLWKRRFGVPYVVDFQDPWLNDYYERTGTPPPGGQLRYKLSKIVARKLEPRVMRSVSQVVAVSPGYVETLDSRYPQLGIGRFTVLPFAAPEKDFELLPSLNVHQCVFNPADGKVHLLYAGAAGRIMTTALRLIFIAVAELRASDPATWERVKLHFAGTSYAPAGREKKTVELVARSCGVADLVEESSHRLPYFEVLQALIEADALLVIGSDSPSYTGSKLYPYILARKPMLSVLHEKSPAVQIVRDCRAGKVVTFDPAAAERSLNSTIEGLTWLRSAASSGRAGNVDWQEFDRYTAREMTRRLCGVFDRACETAA